MFDLLQEGWSQLTLSAALYLLLGAVIGNLAALLPGLGSFQAIAVFLPLSAYMETIPALALATGIYAGGQYGGAIPAILFGTPGTAEAAATTLDGVPMREKGQAARALRLALFAGVTGDIVAALVLIFGVGLLAPVALQIGQAEYFGLIFAALSLIAVVSGSSPRKGAVAVSLGLILSTIGTDPISGTPRLTFGFLELSSGIGVVPAILGLFALSELMRQMLARQEFRPDAFDMPEETKVSGLADYRACAGAIAVGTTVGVFIGLLPGLGATVAAFVAYAIGKRLLRDTHNFGKGDPRGVALTESANDATVGPTLVPLITLGLPGSPTAALFLALFLLQGIQVGPLVMKDEGPIMYALFIMFLVMPIVNLAAGYYLRKAAPAVLRIPTHLLTPALLVLTLVGTYATRFNPFDVAVAVVFGFIGFALRVVGVPLAPLLIAFLLGQPAEAALRRSMVIFDGEVTEFLHHPIAMVGLVSGVLIVAGSVIAERRMRKEEGEHAEPAPRWS